VLSLAVLCRHVALRDLGKSVGCLYPVPSPTTLAFDLIGKSRHFQHPPPSDSRGGVRFRGLPTVRIRLQPADLLAPLVGADQAFTQPTGTFTSGLPADWSPAPPPDMTTVATGQVPPAGLTAVHPLDHQLASLQPITKTYRDLSRKSLSAHDSSETFRLRFPRRPPTLLAHAATRCPPEQTKHRSMHNAPQRPVLARCAAACRWPPQLS